MHPRLVNISDIFSIYSCSSTVYCTCIYMYTQPQYLQYTCIYNNSIYSIHVYTTTLSTVYMYIQPQYLQYTCIHSHSIYSIHVYTTTVSTVYMYTHPQYLQYIYNTQPQYLQYTCIHSHSIHNHIKLPFNPHCIQTDRKYDVYGKKTFTLSG